MFRALALYVSLLLLAEQMPKPRPAAKQCRDAITGQYVTPEYAKKHPKTTVCERVV